MGFRVSIGVSGSTPEVPCHRLQYSEHISLKISRVVCASLGGLLLTDSQKFACAGKFTPILSPPEEVLWKMICVSDRARTQGYSHQSVKLLEHQHLPQTATPDPTTCSSLDETSSSTLFALSPSPPVAHPTRRTPHQHWEQSSPRSGVLSFSPSTTTAPDTAASSLSLHARF